MADIFDEVNEDLKRDQMQQLWSRYGKYVILAVSIVVISVGGRQGYTAWQARQAAAAATARSRADPSSSSRVGGPPLPALHAGLRTPSAGPRCGRICLQARSRCCGCMGSS